MRASNGYETHDLLPGAIEINAANTRAMLVKPKEFSKFILSRVWRLKAMMGPRQVDLAACSPPGGWSRG
jgi:hypothetical protein